MQILNALLVGCEQLDGFELEVFGSIPSQVFTAYLLNIMQIDSASFYFLRYLIMNQISTSALLASLLMLSTCFKFGTTYYVIIDWDLATSFLAPAFQSLS